MRPYHEPVHELLKRIDNSKNTGATKDKTVRGRNLLSKDLVFSHSIPHALETFNLSGSTSGEYGYSQFGQKLSQKTNILQDYGKSSDNSKPTTAAFGNTDIYSPRIPDNYSVAL